MKPLCDGDAAAEATCRDGFDNPGLSAAPVTREILVEAARVRAMIGLKLPDAVHATTAALSGSDVLLTNDARLRAADSGVDVVLLSEMTP